MAGDLKLKIFRFDPRASAGPRYDTFAVPRTPDMRVLDALNFVFDNSNEGALAHRWFCGTKKCGECAIMVNGRPMLTCWEPALDEMICEPLANFPIVRDLVVDTQPYERLIVQLRPYLTRSTRPSFPEKIRASQMAAAQHLSKCIECCACTAAVPVNDVGVDGIAWNGYSGPAALVRFARFVLDPRDETMRKADAVRAGLREFPHYSVLRDICPQGIDIIGEALVPAAEKLFGQCDGGTSVDPPSSAPFIKARTWSAFVRLKEDQKRELVARGRLAAIDFPDSREAYALIES